MIDIHTHVLPGVDDGSSSMDMSLEMLFLAAESGVDTLVATPHCNIPNEYENYVSDELTELWDQLNRKKDSLNIPLQLCRGMEAFATANLPELLEQGRIWTLNDTSYFLTEFSFDEDPDFCWEVLRRCERRGFRPIIAHPERYFFVQADLQLAYEWCTAGYGLQINKGSLLGRFGPEPQYAAEILLEHGLAACVASDAHHPNQRSTYMGEIRLYLNEIFGESYMHLLLEENPARILSGRDLLGFDPIPIS